MKIFIKTTLKSMEEETSYEGYGILTENKIVYTENGVRTTIKVEQDKVSMKRNHDTYELLLHWDKKKKTDGIYKIYELHSEIHLQIETNMLELSSQEIKVKYQLKQEDVIGNYEFHLTYEVKE